MASKSVSTYVMLLGLMCLLLMRHPSDRSTAYRANVAGTKDIIRNRKVKHARNRVLSVVKIKKSTLSARLRGLSHNKYGEKSLSWELRKVPSGPDPLHHNGGGPKPETP